MTKNNENFEIRTFSQGNLYTTGPNGSVAKVVEATHEHFDGTYRWLLANEEGNVVASILGNSKRSVEAESFEQAEQLLSEPRPIYERLDNGRLQEPVVILGYNRVSADT